LCFNLFEVNYIVVCTLQRNPVKKAKTESSSSASAASSSRRTEDKEPTWELERNRFVKVREFKGRVFIDIREFYDAGGELKPGKKGTLISCWNLDVGFIKLLKYSSKFG
jgi:hypothetical protein